MPGGGGPFASTEILAFASLILLRFDNTSTSEGGWEYKGTHIGFHLPGQDVNVQLTQRDNKKWYFFSSEAGKSMEMSSENADAAKVGAQNGRWLRCQSDK